MLPSLAGAVAILAGLTICTAPTASASWRPRGHSVRRALSDAAVRTRLIALLENVKHATAASYQTRDNTGFTVDTIKIISSPGGGYLGIYHVNDKGFFSVRLGFSSDLLHWNYIRTLEPDAVQPTMAALPGGEFLVAYEKRELDGTSHLEFRVYGSIKALLSGVFIRQFDAPRTLSPVAEGTPSIYRMSIDRTVEHSTIVVGFHYFDTALGVDRNAVGTLKDFSRWSTALSPIDAAFHPEPPGGTGARDTFTFEGYQFTVIEGWSIWGDWGSWRVYLYDPRARTVSELPIHTALGSTSIGTPHVTVLTDPAHSPALVASFYLFTPGAAGNEAGPLIYYRQF